MKRLNLPIATACAALLSLTASPSLAQSPDSHPAPAQAKGTPDVLTPQAQRKTAPDFTLTDENGQPLALSAYKGKVVLLDFWATWCGGCKVEIPWYVEFDQKYRDKGLTVIGVSMDDKGMKVVKPFLAEKKIEYPVVIGNDQLANQYNLTQMPMTLLIDRDGKIAVSHTGIVDKENFESHIKALLN
jgi:cytochrome c biogenesis protein CcmG/thiol:disulfide interchange protein DsbE